VGSSGLDGEDLLDYLRATVEEEGLDGELMDYRIDLSP